MFYNFFLSSKFKLFLPSLHLHRYLDWIPSDVVVVVFIQSSNWKHDSNTTRFRHMLLFLLVSPAKYHTVKPTRQTRTRPPPVVSCVDVAPGKPAGGGGRKNNNPLLHYHCGWGHGGREPLAVGENISGDLLRFLAHSAPSFNNRKWWQLHQSCGTAGCLNLPVRLGHLQYGCPGVSWTRGTRIKSIKHRLHLRSENSRFWGIVYGFASTTVLG